MQRYLLDTSVLIDFSKDYEPTKSALLELVYNKEKLAICAITVAEFYTGIIPEAREKWDRFIKELVYWDISLDAAKRAGHYRYMFAKRGITISTTDSLIAAVAYENNATILTDNVKDFPMDDITVMSLRDQ